MKRTIAFLLCIILCLGLFTGCAKEGELVGNWVTTDGYDMSYSFKKNGNGKLFGWLPFTYSTEDGVLTMNYEDGSTDQYHYRLENDTLILSGPAGMEIQLAKK